MKNIVFSYNDYQKDIFKGDSINVKLAYFAGFRFMLEDDDSYSKLSYIAFQLVTEENKVLTLNMNIQFDNDEEADQYYLDYSDMGLVGTALAIQVPSLMQLSCFYKEKILGTEVYNMYAKHISPDQNVVYKLCFNKSSFLYIMDIMGGIEDRIFRNYNEGAIVNNYINAKTIKVHSSADFQIAAIYLEKRGGFFNYFYTGQYVVTFLEKNKDNDSYREGFNMLLPILEDKELRKYLNKEILFDEDEFKSFVNNIDYYEPIDIIRTKFSKSADLPMNFYTFICKNPEKDDIVFVDMHPNIYNNIKVNLADLLKK